MTQILVTKPGSVSHGDRAALRNDGIIVVETDNPADVKMLGPDGASIGAGGLLYAAIEALSTDRTHAVTHAHDRFVATLLAEIERERAAKLGPPRDARGHFISTKAPKA